VKDLFVIPLEKYPILNTRLKIIQGVNNDTSSQPNSQEQRLMALKN
jgi:hypothetical protein